MGCSGSKEAVAPSRGINATASARMTAEAAKSAQSHTPATSAAPASGGLIKKESRGVLLKKVPSKALFSAESKHHPISHSVGRKQKRGSVTKAHGMSFTEIKLPAEQVIDIQTQQRLETNAEGDDEDGADNGDAADDDVSPEDRAIQERVYKAVLAGMADVVALMKTEPSNPVLQWWCCDGIASLCAGNAENRAMAEREGAPQLIVEAMNTFPDDANVQLKSCWAIAGLSGDFADELCNIGAVVAILHALDRTEDYSLRSVIIRCLSSLCQAGACARVARSNDAQPKVQRVLDAHPDDGELVYRCQRLLHELKPVDNNMSMRITRVPTKRMFGPNGTKRGASENVSDLHRCGSASRTHGMSFTEMKLPADQIISLHTEKLVGSHSKQELMEDEQQREKTVADRVYAAIPDGVPAVLELMRSDPSHAELQWWCADAIASLTVGNAENQAAVAEQGGVQLVLQAMDRFPDNENVATKCMWAITNLAASQAAKIAELGGVHSAVVCAKLVQVHELQSVFIRALGNLIVDEANLRTALEEGAIKVVEDIIEANQEHGQLLYRANGLLDTLQAEAEDDEPVTTIVSAEEVAGVAAADAGAGTGSGSGAGAGSGEAAAPKPLQRFESKRLFDPAAASTPKSTSVGRKQRRGSVSKAHGMSFTEIKLPADQVLSLHAEKAIKEHVHQPEALREAADPATEETPEQVIYKAALSGIVAVVAAMKASPDDAPTQWHGCDAVASLTAGKPDNRAACKEEGGLDAVVAALKRFPDNVTVQLKGAWAVANLAADYAAELGELGAVDAVVALMRVDDYQLKSVGVRALYNLCTTEPNTALAVKLGAADVVEAILESHGEDGQLVFRTNNLLAVLREGEEEEEVVRI